MGTTRELTQPPSMGMAYARAALSLVPGASMLSGRGDAGELPDTELTLPDVGAPVEDVAAYARVCGFRLHNELPPTYPHVLAFPLHMALMTRGDFPFPPVGLVHLENRIVAHRPVRLTERLTLRVHAAGPEPHPKGRTFTIVTEAWSGQERVWEEQSTVLSRGTGGGSGAGGPGGGSGAATASDQEAFTTGGDVRPQDGPAVPGVREADDAMAAAAEWGVSADTGRRYAAVSGDRNPIHLHPVTARLFGFRRPIAHGMWTKARCLAFLEGRLPGAFSVHVRFRAPVLLPARVCLATATARGNATDTGSDAVAGTTAPARFRLYDAKTAKPHLHGSVEF